MRRVVDYSTLTDPAPSSAVAAHYESVRSRPGFRTVSLTSAPWLVVLGAVLCAGVLGWAWFVASSILSGELSFRETPGFASVVILFSWVALGAAALALGTFVSAREALQRRDTWYRAHRFATAHGMRYSARALNRVFAGIRFRPGDAVLVDRFVDRGGAFEYGTVLRITGRGRNAVTDSCGYAAIALERPLPRMILDSRSARGGLSMGASLDRSQVLSLEGDFDSHFVLYCPPEYERDALYVFTPDLMAALVDHAPDCDVEIADAWLFAYSAAFDPRDPAAHARFLAVVDGVGPIARVSRYTDARSTRPGTVAPRGRWLAARIPRLAWVVPWVVAASVFSPWITAVLLR